MDNNKKEEIKREKKVKSTFERIKNSDLKKKSRFVVIFFFIFSLVFGTITNIGFAPFDFFTWLADMLILLGIEVFGLIFGELSGTDKFHEDLNGNYQRNLKVYNEQMTTNSNDIYRGFAQWYSQKLPNELFNKKRDYLTSVGIEYDNACAIIQYLDISEIDRLVNDDVFKEDKKIGKIFISKIKDYQKDAVKFVLGGDVKLDAPNASYYLTAANDKYGNLSIFELGNAYQKDIKQTRNMTRVVKLASSTIISAFMASLTVYNLMSGDSLQAWMKLLSRLTALFTSLFSGYLSAATTVKIEAKAIKNKSIAIGMFLVDLKGKYFVPKTKEEIMKEKWKEHERKEQEARDKVITPEVIDTKKPKSLENKSRQIPLH